VLEDIPVYLRTAAEKKPIP